MKSTIIKLLFFFCFTGIINAQSVFVNYPLNSNATDSSVHNYFGTVYGGMGGTTDRHGNANGAYLFDGINDYISGGTWSGLSSIYQSFSVSFWIKTTNTGMSSQSFLFGTINSPGNGLTFSLALNGTYQNTWAPGYMYFYLRDNAGRLFSLSVNENKVFDNTWHCVTFVVKNLNNKTYQVYVDAEPVTAVLFDNQNPSTWLEYEYPFAIGALNNRGNVQGFFKGSLDEFRIYGYQLSDVEVLENCNNKNVGSNELFSFVKPCEVYPVPSADLINIIKNDNKTDRMKIISVNGSVLYDGEIKSQLNILEYSTGMYNILFFNNGIRVGSEKIVKE